MLFNRIRGRNIHALVDPVTHSQLQGWDGGWKGKLVYGYE